MEDLLEYRRTHAGKLERARDRFGWLGDSFNVLIKEIQSLGLDIKLQKRDALSYGS